MKKSTKTVAILMSIIALLFIIMLLIDISIVARGEVIFLLIFSELMLAFIGFSFYRYQSAKEETKSLGLSDQYTVCKHCGTKNRKRISYCVKCKSSIVIKVCPICIEVNQHDAKYCVTCDSILQNTGNH